MPDLTSQLDLERCPHCNVDKPTLTARADFQTIAERGKEIRIWKFYFCARCGGVVTATAPEQNKRISQIFPAPVDVDASVPEVAREYLRQAISSTSAPAGAVMLAASAVDAMLKAKDYTEGSLYSRINSARDDHLITPEMAEWAHEVRLDANDLRHADETKPIPDIADATRVIEFTQALAQFIFVLPARVTRGRAGQG